MDKTEVSLDQLIQASQTDHRIDVVGLAKRLGLNVYSLDLPENQSGSIKKDEQGSVYIEVNRNHPITRQRFTVAHEIAHFVKHPKQLSEKGQLDRNQNFKDATEIKLETEADQEAAEILMPAYLVDDFFKSNDWTKNTKFNSDMVSEIAEVFRVSRAMAILRLRGIGFNIPFISFA